MPKIDVDGFLGPAIGSYRDPQAIEFLCYVVMAGLAWHSFHTRTSAVPVLLFFAWLTTILFALGLTISRTPQGPALADALCSFSSIGLGLCVAALGGEDLAWVLAIAASIVGVIALAGFRADGHILLSGGVRRAAGGADNVVMTSAALGLLLPVPLDLSLRTRQVAARFLASLCFGVILIGLVCTGSWAAAVAGTVGCLVILLSGKRRLVAAWSLSAVAFIPILLLRTRSVNALTSSSASKLGRLALLKEATSQIWRSWPAGQGLSTPVMVITNPVTHHSAGSLDPHCEPLYAIQQFGLLGVATGLLGIALAVTALKQQTDGAFPNLKVLFIAFAIYSCLETPPPFRMAKKRPIETRDIASRFILQGRNQVTTRV